MSKGPAAARVLGGAVAATVVAASVGLGLQSASAATPPATFSGSCGTFEGELVLAHGVSARSASNSFTLNAPGTCSGAVDGASGSHLSSTLKIAGSGQVSCLNATLPLSGTLTVGDAVIPVHGTFKLTTPNVAVSLIGGGSGLASGSGTVLTSKQNYVSMGGCVTANGVSQADITVSLATSSTMTAPAQPAAPSKHKTVKKKKTKKQATR